MKNIHRELAKKKEEILSDDILCILYLYRTCIRVGGVYYVWARTPFTNVKRRQSKERRKKTVLFTPEMVVSISDQVIEIHNTYNH